MTYRAPVRDLAFTLEAIADMPQLEATGAYPDYDADVAAAVLEAVADLSGWRAGKRPGTGRGVAFCHSFGTPVAQVIEVERRGNAIALTRAFIACDPGIALDPAIIEAQMIGGMVYGLSAAMLGEITFEGGAVQERNFPDYDALRQTGMPETQVRIVASGRRIGGAPVDHRHLLRGCGQLSRHGARGTGHRQLRNRSGRAVEKSAPDT